MKIKTQLIAILLLTVAFVSVATEQTGNKTEDIEIARHHNSDKISKKIILNGKELTKQEIEELEASGKMKTVHLGHGKKGHRVFVVSDDKHQHIKKKWITKGDGENIKVYVDTEGGKTIEKVIVNGKELSAEEIKEFKAKGKMKVINLNTEGGGAKDHKTIFINSEADYDDIDIDVLMEHISELNESFDGKLIKKILIEGDNKNINFIEKRFLVKDTGGASLGFMANVEDDGWHLIKVIDGSGADNAGIKEGDIVIKIANVETAKATDKKLDHRKQLPKFTQDEIVKVQLKRDGELMSFDVKATALNKKTMYVDLASDDGNHIKWAEKIHTSEGLDHEDIKVMVFNGDEDIDFDMDEIHMLFPDDLSDMNLFISDGKSTSSLLGKHHEMSTLSSGLGSYFGTKSGVLVMHVDDSNVFSLADGDVIKSINGITVHSPKDVIKQLLSSENQEQIKLKIVRHKRNKTLKYNK